MGYRKESKYRTQQECINEGLQLLGAIEEAELYDVDANEIFLKPDGKFLLRSASGCSCWDGDWDEITFDSLAELETALLEDACNSNYRPTLKGAEQLIAEARATLGVGRCCMREHQGEVSR